MYNILVYSDYLLGLSLCHCKGESCLTPKLLQLLRQPFSHTHWNHQEILCLVMFLPRRKKSNWAIWDKMNTGNSFYLVVQMLSGKQVMMQYRLKLGCSCQACIWQHHHLSRKILSSWVQWNCEERIQFSKVGHQANQGYIRIINSRRTFSYYWGHQVSFYQWLYICTSKHKEWCLEFLFF